MALTRIPVFRAIGTHFEFGLKIGQLTKDLIDRRLSEDRETFKNLFDFIETNSGKKIYEKFIEVTQKHFPWYWDEIRGLAEGSKVSLEKIAVLNFLNEIRTSYRLEKEANQNETGEKGCTTVLINRKKENIYSIVHNEDHAKALYESSFIVEAEIFSAPYENGKRQSPQEKFIAFCYGGSTPGNAFNVNCHGCGYALNGLYPNFVAEDRLPRQIVNRALLSVRNEEELDILLKSSPVAYGFSINVGFYHHQKYLLNYEIGPNLKIDNENHISKCRIVSEEEEHDAHGNESARSNFLVHYNHYERLNNLIVEQKALNSTHSRWKRGQEFGEITDINTAFQLLGDSKNEEYPIFRTSSGSDVGSCTLCTAHIDFRSEEMIIYQENPKENRQPSLIFKFAQLFS